MSQQVTTITFCKYSSLASKIWAFTMMQFAHSYLREVKGLTFYKLMGSGKGLGFNPFPDWSVYCLLQVWENDQYAREFLDQSPLIIKYKQHSRETATIFMKNITADGKWSGMMPFETNGQLDQKNPYIAVITRATIKFSKLAKFWNYVPTSQKPIGQAKGLIYTKGIGEVPIKQMATFSIWENVTQMKNFAYHSREHQQAIKMTKELNWYREELFARFQPYDSLGTWQGKEWNFSGQDTQQ